MSGWARIGLFLLVQTVMKTITTPLAGSRAGKCTGVFRCIRSFMLSEGHASSWPVRSSRPRCLSCPPRRVDSLHPFSHVPFCFGHDEAWPSDSPQTPPVGMNLCLEYFDQPFGHVTILWQTPRRTSALFRTCSWGQDRAEVAQTFGSASRHQQVLLEEHRLYALLCALPR